MFCIIGVLAWMSYDGKCAVLRSVCKAGLSGARQSGPFGCCAETSLVLYLWQDLASYGNLRTTPLHADFTHILDWVVLRSISASWGTAAQHKWILLLVVLTSYGKHPYNP